MAEDRFDHPILVDDHLCESSFIGTVRSSRYAPPSHCIFKIESFSFLVRALEKSGIHECETDSFESCSYSWKLRLYPNGDKRRNGGGHISLYLVLQDATSLPDGVVLSVSYKLFLYDHIRSKFITFEQDGCEERNKFHKFKSECGISQLLPLEVFKNAPNGYLANDSCVFGAEVFVIHNKPKIECLSILQPRNHSVVRLQLSCILWLGGYHSQTFVAGGKHWAIVLNPRMYPKEDWKHMDLYLSLKNGIMEWCFNSSEQVYVDFKLRLKNQISGNHVEKQHCGVFTHGHNLGIGSPFMEMSRLKDVSLGFVVDDFFIVEVEFSTILCRNKAPSVTNGIGSKW